MKPPNPDELDVCLRVLETVAADRARLVDLDEERRKRLLYLAGIVSRPTRHERRRAAKAFRKQDRAVVRARDAALVARTLNRITRRSSEVILPGSTARDDASQPIVDGGGAEQLAEPRGCYICKTKYRRIHHFYDALCPECADLNYRKRFHTARLDGRVALVTGARIKIGYQASLMMLRAGAAVIATTRFPRDAERRYAREPDYESWRARLTVSALDLVHTPSVENFTRHLADTLPRLDFIINNAAQTVRRPPAFYGHLLEGEGRDPAALEKIDTALFPRGLVDLDEQQIDLRPINSWRLTAADVPTVELLEVHLVNAVAPFLLVSRLKPLMLRHPSGDKHVVNVSAMEAQFARNKKTEKHPHTNMAKAALNMLTRTSAVDYVRDGIHMNSVDTGWVTDEDPLPHVARKQAVHDFHPPLDAIDGAARVLDPIFTGFATGQHPWGLFLKDYKPVAW